MTLRSLIISAALMFVCLTATAQEEPQRYARFEVDGKASYGRVEGEQIRQLKGDLFGQWEATDQLHALESVKLLVPTTPKHVLAMAGNYKSHLSKGPVTTTITTVTTVRTDPETDETTTDTTTQSEVRKAGEVPEKFSIPQPFMKSVSALTAHDTPIILPKGSTTVHFEAEMVVVIGKQAQNITAEEAADYVFGVTCGNDVSARVWQRNDVQWWRAKGSDTFAPCGPFIARGLDYNDLLLQLRLNGEVKQKESSSQLIHDVDSTVAFISQHVTLEPGDLIFMGTPGQTSEIKQGDDVEVELQGVGVLRNSVVDEK